MYAQTGSLSIQYVNRGCSQNFQSSHLLHRSTCSSPPHFSKGIRFKIFPYEMRANFCIKSRLWDLIQHSTVVYGAMPIWCTHIGRIIKVWRLTKVRVAGCGYAGFGPQIAGCGYARCRPQIAGCGYAGCGLQAINCGYAGCGPQIVGCGYVGHRLRAAGYKLRVAGMWVTDCSLWATGCGLQAKCGLRAKYLDPFMWLDCGVLIYM